MFFFLIDQELMSFLFWLLPSSYPVGVRFKYPENQLRTREIRQLYIEGEYLLYVQGNSHRNTGGEWGELHEENETVS